MRMAEIVHGQVLRWRIKERIGGAAARWPLVGGLLISVDSRLRGQDRTTRTYRRLTLTIAAELRKGPKSLTSPRTAPSTDSWYLVRNVVLLEIQLGVDANVAKIIAGLGANNPEVVVVAAVTSPSTATLRMISDAGIVALALDSTESVYELSERLTGMFPSVDRVWDIGRFSIESVETDVPTSEGLFTGLWEASLDTVDRELPGPSISVPDSLSPSRPMRLSVGASGDLKINIVDHESAYGGEWILTAISQRLGVALRDLGVVAEVTSHPKPGFDVYHHIPYYAYRSVANGEQNSMMVTHIDADAKVRYIEQTLLQGADAICMSSDTALLLRERLPEFQTRIHWVVPPPLRGEFTPQVKIGCFFRIYSDGRKRERELLSLARMLGPHNLSFHIMGADWGRVSDELRDLGCAVTVHEEFATHQYVEMLHNIDFAIYFGLDEGAMFFMDALSVGCRVIVPHSGYHLDLPNPLVSYAGNAAEAASIIRPLILLQCSGPKLLESYSWRRYATLHMSIWDSRR